MEVLSGTVDSIVYRSEENGYTIAKIKDDNIIYTIVGEIPHIRERQLLNFQVLGLIILVLEKSSRLKFVRK